MKKRIITPETEIGTRVYSDNYGYGTITKKISNGYEMFLIELDGLTLNGIEHFKPGHGVHCDVYGHRSFTGDPDIHVDFFIVEE